jgi:hypothetical protein
MWIGSTIYRRDAEPKSSRAGNTGNPRFILATQSVRKGSSISVSRSFVSTGGAGVCCVVAAAMGPTIPFGSGVGEGKCRWKGPRRIASLIQGQFSEHCCQGRSRCSTHHGVWWRSGGKCRRCREVGCRRRSEMGGWRRVCRSRGSCD